MDSAVDRYDELESSYLPDDPSEDAVIHIYIAAVEFQLRFVAMCAAAAMRDLDPDQVRMHRSPGFGTFQTFLSRASSFLRSSVQSGDNDQIVNLIETSINELHATDGRDQQFGTLEKLRNHLFHGNPMPSGEAGSQATMRAKRITAALSDLIRRFLTGAGISVLSEESGLHRLELRWKNRRLSLWPFICVDDAGRLCVFSNFGSMWPTYMRAGDENVRLSGSGDELLFALSESMLSREFDKTFPGFLSDIRADLDGFRESDQQLYHYELDGAVTIFWARALSSGTERRTDQFRLGDGDQRQWLDPESRDWVPYPDFLRNIVNWQVVARRVRQHLETIEDELIAGERTDLGWTKSSTQLIEPKVRVARLQGAGEEYMSFTDLQNDIDQRLSSRGSKTRIYFVEGEAGIGKTRMLVRAAIDRAKAIENEGDEIASPSRLPLFYYVRSTGQTSNSLDTVINAAAAPTQNLKVQNIKSLCRNGLIALFVDGFDELLGGVGYENALGALRTWIDAMAGRGVIVVSSRSSYYLNQYTASLQKEQQRKDLMVEHRVASVQLWNDGQIRNFFLQYGLDPAEHQVLHEDDRNLLRLPFFARVYVESINSTIDGDQSLPDLALRQYIAREASKLIMPGDQDAPLLSSEELHATFEAIAQLMAEEGAREVELEDLELAVQAALNEDDIEVRRGLKQRLSVLCGLAVSGSSSPHKMFSFQHELFYDIFLGDAILRELAYQKYDNVSSLLGKVQLRIATASRIARKSPIRLEALLRTRSRDSASLPIARQKAYSANLGSLWEALIHKTNRVERVEIFGLTFSKLDLTTTKINQVTFERCHFEYLKLPAMECEELRLNSCTIESLWLDREGAPLRGIKSFEETLVSQLVRQASLVEKPREIQRSLGELGVPVPTIDEPRDDNWFEEAVEFFLEHYSRRVDSVIIYERTHAPADDNPPWQLQYGSEAWTTFIRLLNESGAGRLNPIAAGGPPVLRVKIYSIERLRNREIPGNPAVATFWELVQAQNVKIV